MGGRGASGSGTAKGRSGSSDGVFASEKPREIETVYFSYGARSGPRYKDEILEAKTDGNGNITFTYASGGTFEKQAKTNKTAQVTFKVLAGAINGDTFNIDWSKVKSISGQTYSLRQAAKEAGLKWDGKTKRWVRK